MNSQVSSKNSSMVDNERSVHRLFITISVFAIAMGFLEAIVVVYLRQIYYPMGFDFPLTILSPSMYSIELLREAVTLIMLVIIGIIAGKNNLQKFSYFIFCFGVWDIFYYVGLKTLIDWPTSLLTWDVLFLIPVPWVGPVLAPVICSLTMIFLAMCIVYPQEKGYIISLKFKEWSLILIGSFIILYTFTWDYINLIIEGGFLGNSWSLRTDERFNQIISEFIPTCYNWIIFTTGEILILLAIVLIIANVKYQKQL